MTIPGSLSSPLLASAVGAAGPFEVSRSLRFNAPDGSFLNRTPSSAGNRRTWTWSGWVKKTNINTYTSLFSAGNNPWVGIDFLSDQLSVVLNAGSGDVGGRSDALFRDLSAWYHIVVAVDTTQATAADRIKIYANGVELSFTANGDGLPSQNYDTLVNTAITHRLGADGRVSGGGIRYGDIYLAECILVDGSALDPTSFGAFDDNGVWQAIDTAGLSFGTNGFRLKFADNSGSTATTLGKDTSGNSNNWTPNNLSVDDGTGAVYTNNLVASGSLYPGTALSNPFDGSTSTVAMMTNSTQNQTLTFTPTGGIAYSSSVEVFLTPTGNVGVTRYSVNGGSDQSFASGDTYKTILSGSGTLTSFVLKQGAQSNGVGFSAIRIDGSTILIDSNGANNDSLVDSPTNAATPSDSGIGGEVIGNYCTMNPLDNGGLTLANGNLDVTMSTSAWRNCRATIGMTTGKWYFEVECKASTSGQGLMPGILNAAGSITTTVGANSGGYAYNAAGGNKYNNGTGSSYGATFDNGDIIGVAYDGDNGAITFYKNGASQGVAFTSIPSGTYFPAVAMTGTMSASINFGQRAFAYQNAGTNRPSADYKSLNTANLPTPTIADGSKYFDTKLYSGTGSTQSITMDNSALSPDFVWIKNRNANGSHDLYDIVRGADAVINSDATHAEYSGSGRLTAFGSNGFTLGSQSAVNISGGPFVSWNWDGGTSTVTNNDGSIASQVRAQPSAGFSICTYTGNGSSGASIGHALNAAPSVVLVKRRNSSAYWEMFHASVGNTKVLYLNVTDAATTSSASWNNTSPTSSVVTFGNSSGTNASGSTYVAYCFAPVAGYSAMGSFVSNNSADGNFIYLGFRPSWILVKRTDSTSNWFILDTARDTYNVMDAVLDANLSDAERHADIWDSLSNGMKLRIALPGTFIYYAVSENPFQANGGLAR